MSDSIKRAGIIVAAIVAIMLSSVGARAFFGGNEILLSRGPSGPFPTAISPSSASAVDTATSGTVITALGCTMSDSSSCSAGFGVTDPNGLVSVSGSNLVAAHTYTSANDGTFSNITLRATKNGHTISQGFTLTIAASGGGGGAVPAAAQAVGFTQHAFHADFTDPFYQTKTNWSADCGGNPTSLGPGAHSWWWRSWIGFGTSRTAPCGNFNVVQDPRFGNFAMAVATNDANDGGTAGAYLQSGTDANGKCQNQNGAFCPNFYYIEVVSRGDTFDNAHQSYDWWSVGCPELDGLETGLISGQLANGAGFMATLHNENCANSGTGGGAGGYDISGFGIDMSQYFKIGWRYATIAGASNGSCFNGNGDNTKAFISAYISQNTTGDPTRVNGGGVCIGNAQIEGQNNDGADAPINISNSAQLGGFNQNRIMYVKSVDAWTCPQWSPTNQTPSNCNSPTFNPSP